MRTGIHPEYKQVEVTCACGHTFLTRSTMKKIRLDICSNCHPFYTGKQKLLDIAGRVERFTKRFAKTGGRTVARKPKALKAVAKTSKRTRKVLKNTPRVEGPKKSDKKGPRGAKPPKPAKAAEKS